MRFLRQDFLRTVYVVFCEFSLMTKVFKASLRAPLVAPLVVAISWLCLGLLAYPVKCLLAGGELCSAGRIVLPIVAGFFVTLFGIPISYGLFFIIALPAIILLRSFGLYSLLSLSIVGALVGLLATACVFDEHSSIFRMFYPPQVIESWSQEISLFRASPELIISFLGHLTVFSLAGIASAYSFWSISGQVKDNIIENAPPLLSNNFVLRKIKETTKWFL